MSSYFYINTDLSSNDLRITLRDNCGRPTDHVPVVYTVFASDGSVRSGRNLAAINLGNGIYYASYRANSYGSHYAEWSVNGSLVGKSSFWVQEDGLIVLKNGVVSNTGLIPDPSSGTYFVGYQFGPDDLTAVFLDAYNQPIDPSLVTYQIFDDQGKCLNRITVALKASTGRYYSDWKVKGRSGTYKIVYYYVDPDNGIAQSMQKEFVVICPSNQTSYSSNTSTKSCACNSSFHRGGSSC